MVLESHGYVVMVLESDDYGANVCPRLLLTARKTSHGKGPVGPMTESNGYGVR
jgi:hypothetical protein